MNSYIRAACIALLVTGAAAAGCQQQPDRPGVKRPQHAAASVDSQRVKRPEQAVAPADMDTSDALTGIGPRGIPYYASRAFSSSERSLLLAAFGVDDPQWLYLSDSTSSAIVKYDTRAKRCRTCYVDSYRLGFLSMRRPGELWDDFERRIARTSPRDYPPSTRVADVSLDRLDPDARQAFTDLIEAGRRAGFSLRVRETYRTPERETLLFEEGHGRTYTATSMHSYGRAVDIVVGNGNDQRTATRVEWVRFRRFVLSRPNGHFQLVGSVDHTWDWPHVELPAAWLGFHSIENALAFAARCTSDSARANPPAIAALGGGASDPCVFVPNLPEAMKRGG
jgi:hypothetical protein